MTASKLVRLHPIQVGCRMQMHIAKSTRCRLATSVKAVISRRFVSSIGFREMGIWTQRRWLCYFPLEWVGREISAFEGLELCDGKAITHSS